MNFALGQSYHLVHSHKKTSFQVAHHLRALVLQGQGWISIANKASDINEAGRELYIAVFHLLYVQALQEKPSCRRINILHVPHGIMSEM